MKAREKLDKIFAEAKKSGVTPQLKGYWWVEKAMIEYAKEKCAEQRELCATATNYEYRDEFGSVCDVPWICRNSKEPKFD